MTNLTATQAQLRDEAAECALVRQAYVKRGLHQAHPATDHALINATLAAQDLAVTAGVAQEVLDQDAKIADAEAMRLIWG